MLKSIVFLCSLLFGMPLFAVNQNCTDQITDTMLPAKCGFGDTILATKNGVASFCDFTIQIVPITENGRQYFLCIVAQTRPTVKQSR